MARKTDLPRRIVDAAMALVAERGWRDLTLPDIAEAAGISLTDLLGAFPSKPHVLAGLARIVDEAMLAGDDRADADEPARDRLFDRLMRRFDALQPYRPAIRRLLAEMPSDPVSALRVLPRIGRSMAWTMEAAGISSSGLGGLARIQGLAVIYLRTMRVWAEDDSPDLARTMASLDGLLRRAEEVAAVLGSGRRARPRGA